MKTFPEAATNRSFFEFVAVPQITAVFDTLAGSLSSFLAALLGCLKSPFALIEKFFLG